MCYSRFISFSLLFFSLSLLFSFFLFKSQKFSPELSPDEGYVAREEEREKKELKDIETRLTEEEVKEIKKKGIALEERQNTKDDPNCLPSLDLGDVSQVFIYFFILFFILIFI